MADSNPFADTEGDNPFADPSITSHTVAAQNALEGRRSPFDDNTITASSMNASNTTVAREKTRNEIVPEPPRKTEPPLQPAVVETQPADGPPAYREVAAANSEEFYAREQELERKAAELNRKEEAMRNVNKGVVLKANNFPPLPKKCCIQPCWYHDIGLDIPNEYQRLQKVIYASWYVYVLLLLYNVICAIANLVAGGGSGTVSLALSIVWFVLWAPCSIICWYRPIYKAFRDDSSMNFMMFFFVYFCQIAFCIILAIGPVGSGCCGFITGAYLIDAKKGPGPAVGAMAMICGGFAAALALIQIYLFKRVHHIYRTTGGSMKKAQTEWTTQAAQSDVVKNAVSDAAAAAARNAVENSANTTEYGANYSGNRY